MRKPEKVDGIGPHGLPRARHRRIVIMSVVLLLAAGGSAALLGNRGAEPRRSMPVQHLYAGDDGKVAIVYVGQDLQMDLPDQVSDWTITADSDTLRRIDARSFRARTSNSRVLPTITARKAECATTTGCVVRVQVFILEPGDDPSNDVYSLPNLNYIYHP